MTDWTMDPDSDGFGGAFAAPRGAAPARALPGARRSGAPDRAARGTEAATVEARSMPPRRAEPPLRYAQPERHAASGDRTGATLADLGATRTPGEAGIAARTRLALWTTAAALSVALVGGVGVWGYRLLVREVVGLPVVAAPEGAMRQAPAEPGGQVAAHQGLSVNAVAGVGEAAAPSDVLVLAPATGGLMPEDLEVSTAEAGEPMPAAAIVPAAPAASALAPVTDPTPVVAPPADGATMTPAEILALADHVAAGATPLSPLAPVEGTTLAAPATPPAEGVVAPTALADPAPAATDPAPVEAPASAAVAPAPIPASVPGVASALRPPARPAPAPATVAAVAMAPAPAAPAPEIVPEALPVVPSTVPAGASLVQLGAYDSPEVAAAEWDRLQGPFAEFLEGRERVIQEAESGGRTFFRLRAMGFSDLADARRFCAVLVAEDAGCIPVVAQ